MRQLATTGGTLVLCASLGALLVVPSALAQPASEDPPSAALLHDAESEGLARLVRVRATELGVAEVTTTPHLSLRDLQLSVGCLNASAECLDAVAELLEVDGLLRVRVESDGARRRATVDWHRRGAPEAWRSASGDDSRGAGRMGLLDSADELVRELFDLPPPEPRDASLATPPGGDAVPRRADDGGVSAGPLVLGGAALVVAGGGVALGLLARDNHQQWESAPIGSTEDVDRAIDRYETAEAQARWANVAFVAAGALAVGALLWLVLDLSSGASGGEEERGSLSLGPSGAALRWNADLPWIGGRL